MKHFKISEDVRNGVLNYLAERPYKEVHQGITALLNLPELAEEKSTDDEAKV